MVEPLEEERPPPPSTPFAAFLVLQGVLDLAVADEAIKKSPAKSPVVQVPRHQNEEIKASSDERVNAVIDVHPEPLRAANRRRSVGYLRSWRDITRRWIWLVPS